MPERGDAADVVRIIEGVSGRVPMRMDLRIRFDYGRAIPWMRRIGDHLAGIAGPDSVWLRSPVELEGRDFAHRATFVVCEGDSLPFVFTWHPSHLPAPRDVDPYDALAGTEEYWTDWARQCTYDGQYRDAVVRSLATLKALTYEPTGGIVAAATTSLPEAIGGVRNWDYRFCWLRDATMTLEALLRSGYRDEAKAWRSWLHAGGGRQPRGPADHVRRGGRAPAGGVRAGLAGRLRGLPARYASATPRPSSSSSTCTARWPTRCSSPSTAASSPSGTPGRCRAR